MIEKTYSFKANGKTNDVYTLSNGNMSVDILTYGARIIKITAADKFGDKGDLIVGYATPEEYVGESKYFFGATIGRYANRIGGSSFTLNGVKYKVENNEGENSLHGGKTARFDAETWNAEIEDNALVLTMVSKDGAGGFPGELKVKVKYTLTDSDELVIEYFAVSDKDTVINLTNHSYFNLGGETVLDHELMINSHRITKTGKDLIPHGEFVEIDGTPYGFYPAKTIGRNIGANDELIRYCNGYDFNYCLDRKTAHDLELAASVYCALSGRKMECYTTCCGIQLYTSNNMEGFKGKKTYKTYAALCLETQGYPNSPNCANYPSAVLKKGETYREKTVYKFSVIK